MGSYGAMAYVYDRLMQHVDYAKWARGLETVWKKIGPLPKTVLDAGCGTGSVLLSLAEKNYQVYGVDNSPDMLSICQDKLFEKELDAVLLEMDIRHLKFPLKVDAAICLCDTLNYFLKEEDLVCSFHSVRRALKSGGTFIFDMRTPHYYRDVLSANQWVQEEEDTLLIWDNDFSADPIISIALTFFVRQKNGLYERFEEVHRQRCYEIDHIQELAQAAGLKILQVSSDFKGTPLNQETDERVYFVTSSAM